MSITESIGNRVVRIQGSIEQVPTVPRWVLKGLSVVLFLLSWWALVWLGVLGFDLLRTPLETLVSLVAFLLGEPMGQGSSFYVHSATTLYRVLLGTGLALATAVPLGLAIGWSEWWQDYVQPAFEFLRPIPPVAWVPIALIVFQSELLGIIWVVFVGAFFPILVNTIEGVLRIERDYVRAVRSLGGSRAHVFRHVVIPHAIPSIVTGTVTGVGIGWIAVVAAEMLSGGPGMGYVTFQAYRLMDTGVVLVGIVVLGVYGASSSWIVARVGDRLTPWRAEGTA